MDGNEKGAGSKSSASRASNLRDKTLQVICSNESNVVGTVDSQSNSPEKQTSDHRVTCLNKFNLVRTVDGQSNISLLPQPTLRELQWLLAELRKRVETGERVERAEARPPRSLRRRYPPGVIRQMVREYEAGMTTPELCRKYGISKGGILRLLREEGAQIRSQPMSEDMIAQATQLYRSGVGIPAIAEQLGVTRQGLRRVLVREGIAPRVRQRSTTRRLLQTS